MESDKSIRAWQQPVTDAQGKLERRIEALTNIVVDFHWMGRRYADGRQSYATSLFNEHTRALLAMGVNLNVTGDGTIWARDRDGRGCDGLTDEEARMGDGMPFNRRDYLVSALRDTIATMKAMTSNIPEERVFGMSQAASTIKAAEEALKAQEGAGG